MKNYISILGLILFSYILIKIDITKVFDILIDSNILFLLIAAFLNFPNQLFKSIRWNRILKFQDIHLSLRESFSIYSASTYIGIITPGRIGDFIKVVYLKKNKGIKMSRGFPSVFIDRLFDLYLLVLLGSIGAWEYNIIGKSSNIFIIFSLFIIIAPLFILIKSFMRKISFLFFKLIISKNIKSKLSNDFEIFYGEINKIFSFNLIMIFLITIIGNLIAFMQSYLIILALGIPIDFITTILFMSITSLISFIPISISGLGTRDGILIYLFFCVNLNSELAVSFSILIFVIIYIGVGILGLISWSMNPLKDKLLLND